MILGEAQEKVAASPRIKLGGLESAAPWHLSFGFTYPL
jgi:hypothetical protein